MNVEGLSARIAEGAARMKGFFNSGGGVTMREGGEAAMKSMARHMGRGRNKYYYGAGAVGLGAAATVRSRDRRGVGNSSGAQGLQGRSSGGMYGY